MAIYKNKASQKVAVFAVDADGAAKTGDAAQITAQISLDGAGCAATDDTNPTELDATDAPGIYLFDLTQAETNANLIVLAADSSTSGVVLRPVVIYTEPETRAADVTSLSGDATAADNAEAFFDGTGYAGTNNTIPTVTNITNAVTAGTVSDKTGYGLADSAITSAKFAADAITAASINTGALTADAFAADAIVAATLATGAITADAFAADAIVAATLATGAITSDAFAAGAITNAAVADDVDVNTKTITAGAITAAAIATDAITEIQSGLATPTNITAGTITTVTSVTNGVSLADDAITAAKFDESTAFPLKSADTGATAIARTGADSDTLETLSDEIATVKAETALIVADTNELQTNQGNWATATGFATSTELAKVPKSDGTVTWNSTALASINAEADTALSDYDAPTKTEMDSAFTQIKGATWSDETLVTIQTAADAASAPTVEEIDAELSSTHGSGAWGGAAGSGATSRQWPKAADAVQDDDGNLLDGAAVWVTSDEDGNTGVAGPQYTQSNGLCPYNWLLDGSEENPVTYYGWVQLAGYTFDNPTEFVVPDPDA